MKFHNGYKDIKVTLVDWAGNNFAKKVYEFGRLSHDFDEVLPEEYTERNPNCIKLINKIIDGTTLPKYAMQGTRLVFRIEGISRICLAQLTRDSAIFASQGGGVHPLTQDFNMPLSILQYDDVMEKVKQAQYLLEEAYIMLAEREVPALEARYIGLHSQTISLTAAYTPADFVRSCYSRTSSNFCDECNYVYRLMYKELRNAMSTLSDINSYNLWVWIAPENKCINDGIYERERLYNSDFTDWEQRVYEPKLPAINDWRKSCWKTELERMYVTGNGYLTNREQELIRKWCKEESEGNELDTSYDPDASDVLKNAIKRMDYYKEHRYVKE